MFLGVQLRLCLEVDSKQQGQHARTHTRQTWCIRLDWRVRLAICSQIFQ